MYGYTIGRLCIDKDCFENKKVKFHKGKYAKIAISGKAEFASTKCETIC